MPKKMLHALWAMIVLLAAVTVATAADAPADQRKHTKAGLYATAKEAYEMWKKDKDKINIVDCRTPEEYGFVGHPAMAFNIPSKFMTYEWNEEKKEYVMKTNDKFVDLVKARFKTDDVIMILCRSGHRSAESVNKLFEAGFTNVYNIIDGFEGDKDGNQDSPTFGKRTINGWSNSGAPWTYDLDKNLAYLPAK